jgi:AhpD family alkylhydroperoxidase
MNKEEKKKLIAKLRRERDRFLNFYGLLLKNDPEMMNKWDDLYSTAKFQKRFLTGREKELVDIAISATMKWGIGLQVHIKKAINMGITEQEIMEIFSLTAMSSGIPCMMFASDVYAEMKKNNFEYSFPQYDFKDLDD